MTFGEDKWDKAYERVVLTEDKTGFKNTQNMFGFGDNLPINEGFGDVVKGFGRNAAMTAGTLGLGAASLFGNPEGGQNVDHHEHYTHASEQHSELKDKFNKQLKELQDLKSLKASENTTKYDAQIQTLTKNLKGLHKFVTSSAENITRLQNQLLQSTPSNDQQVNVPSQSPSAPTNVNQRPFRGTEDIGIVVRTGDDTLNHELRTWVLKPELFRWWEKNQTPRITGMVVFVQYNIPDNIPHITIEMKLDGRGRSVQSDHDKEFKKMSAEEIVSASLKGTLAKAKALINETNDDKPKFKGRR